MAARPQNIGIKAIEIYFPNQVSPEIMLSSGEKLFFFFLTANVNSCLQCVEQSELEKFDGVSQGKYTIGLGQTKMSFCNDREGKNRVPRVTIGLPFTEYYKISTPFRSPCFPIS